MRLRLVCLLLFFILIHTISLATKEIKRPKPLHLANILLIEIDAENFCNQKPSTQIREEPLTHKKIPLPPKKRKISYTYRRQTFQTPPQNPKFYLPYLGVYSVADIQRNSSRFYQQLFALYMQNHDPSILPALKLVSQYAFFK